MYRQSQIPFIYICVLQWDVRCLLMVHKVCSEYKTHTTHDHRAAASCHWWVFHVKCALDEFTSTHTHCTHYNRPHTLIHRYITPLQVIWLYAHIYFNQQPPYGNKYVGMVGTTPVIYWYICSIRCSNGKYSYITHRSAHIKQLGF